MVRQWAVCLGLALLVLAPLGVVVPIGGLLAGAATLHPVAAQTSAVQLVQKYLSALGPAGIKLSKVEAALKALGPTATRAQVLAAVAPLGPALAPIEALLAAPPPTTLEALGHQQGPLGYDATYRTTGQGARLDVGGKLYPNGFQVDMLSYATLIWPTHDRYATLSAQLGTDGLDRNKGALVTVSFDDSTNTSIPFFDGGKLVFAASVPATGFISLSVPLAHIPEVKMLFSLGVQAAAWST